MSLVFSLPKSEARSPEKKSIEKKTKSRAYKQREVALTSGVNTDALMEVHSEENLSKNSGTAFRSIILACACSSRMD